MTKIDKEYLEKLGEVLYDEKKALNYKSVSMLMGVHVNIAKQMLYHMNKSAESAGKKLYATYYISGLLPRKNLKSLEAKDGANPVSETPEDESNVYLVSLCNENKLDEVKLKYTTIFSIHLYALSPFPVDNYDVLGNLVEYPMRDAEGRTPVDFGPIVCSASQKLAPDAKPLPRPVAPTEKPKSQNGETAKHQTKPEKINGFKSGSAAVSPVKSSEKQEATQETKSQTQKTVKPVANDKKDGGRLKSMFATAASKPKPKPKEKETEKSKPVGNKAVTCFPPQRESSEDKSSKCNKDKDKDSRKRKRIRDVLSSDSEEEAKASEDEGSEPGSPVSKRIQIESDSDDDSKELPKKIEAKASPVPKEQKVPGRKRVAKFVSKSHVDSDGFLVTTKEQVMVSEDEDVEETKDECKKPKLENASNGSSATPLKAAESSSGKSAKVAKNVPQGKSKQASLMSFFQKK